MSSGNENSMGRRRVAGLCLVVALSLVIPLSIAYWSVRFSLSGKPFGWHSNQYKGYSEAIKDGELWFLAAYPLGSDLDNMTDHCHIQRLNLETGLEYDSGIVTSGIKIWGKTPTWVGRDLYLSDPAEVLRIEGQQIAPLGPKRSESASILGPPFEYEGRLTTVVGTEEGGYRLSHWINGQWSDGRRIVLPGISRAWYVNPENDRNSLLPLTSLQPLSLTSKAPPRLDIVNWGGDFQLLIQASDSTFAAYRHGFEFIEADRPIASALAPENAGPEATGWEPVPFFPDKPPTTRRHSYVNMFANREGFYFLVWENSLKRSTRPRIVRRTGHGQYTEVITEFGFSPRSDLRLYSFAADPAEPISYLIRWSQHETDAASISRIERNEIHQPHLHLPGAEGEYFARWPRLAAGLFAAWVFHWAILVAGVSWLTATKTESRYAFGAQRVLLASVCRRGLALVVDVSLTLTVLLLTLWVIMRDLLDRIVWPNEVELHRSLFHIELIFYWFAKLGTSPFKKVWMVTKPLQPFVDSLPLSQEIFFALLLVFAAQYVVKLYVEIRFGATFGKRLLGIRTVKTSLRPAGVARKLVRDTLLWCDVPLLLTPIPAAISMILSVHRQRLGDRVADTLVVRATEFQKDSRH